MALFIGLVFLSLISLTVCNVIHYQPEAVHLAYGGNVILIIYLVNTFFLKNSLIINEI